ncbi:LOW QUALITY PROTEIN: hypothetical protein PHPALM_38005 [Phytophthora palmivora]|uniref:Uncharacterized protein n=1 Tax=Phytophthora palmivora TaxID=4796 RepID=A0A2P4WW24_9STRA|nr:LOW QUALITY PROTEIN: hypothetical protein PHPALM_38005 [Phytophthora palmivora]
MDAAPWSPFPFCSLLNCPSTGEFVYNGRNVCGVHLAQLTQQQPPPLPPLAPSEAPTSQSDACAFPTCHKRGICAHGHDYFCRRYLCWTHTSPVKRSPLELESTKMVVWSKCAKSDIAPETATNVSKTWSSAKITVHQDKFVDKRNAEDYAQYTTENATRTQNCNFVGCTSTNVIQKYHGVFCDQHLPLIDDIRTQIMMAKCHGDEAGQIPLRYNEIFLRKFLDERHVDYYNELVAKYGFVAPIVHVKGDQMQGLSCGPF